MLNIKEIKVGARVTVIGMVESRLHNPGEKHELDETAILPSRYRTGEFLHHAYRYLAKYPCDKIECFALGWTVRNIGTVSPGSMSYSYEYGKEWEPGSMNIDQAVPVLIVMPIVTSGNRYRKPFAVLPEQIVDVLSGNDGE